MKHKCGCTYINGDLLEYCIAHSPNDKIKKQLRVILNELDLKKMIEEILDNRLKTMFDNNKFNLKERMLAYVAKYCSNVKNYGYKSQDHHELDSFIANEISASIKEYVLSKFDIKVEKKV